MITKLKIHVLIGLAGCGIFTPLALSAQEWSQWRGTNRDGVVKDFSPPKKLPEHMKLKWRIPVGTGHASPVVSNGRIYLHVREAEAEVAACYNLKDGGQIWQKKYPAPFTENWYALKHGKGPFSTPIVYSGKLYTLGINGALSCFDAKNGNLNWRQNYLAVGVSESNVYVCVPCAADCHHLTFDAPGKCTVCNMALVKKGLDTSELYYGAAVSPIIENGMCIVHIGNAQQGLLVAADLESGEERWSWDGAAPGYASPIIVEVQGARQLVTITRSGVVGIDLNTGKLLWDVPLEDNWNENIVTPLAFEDLIIVSHVRKGTTAIRPTKKLDTWMTEVAWKNDDVLMFMSSPVIQNGKIYGLSSKHKGQYFCLDAPTGETLWMSEGREGESASIAAAGDWILSVTTDSDFVMIKKDTQRYNVIKKYTVADNPTWAHPVIFSNKILVKDASNMMLWSIE